jgi:hypothetical protein
MSVGYATPTGALLRHLRPPWSGFDRAAAVARLAVLAVLLSVQHAAAEDPTSYDSAEYRKLISEALQEFDHGNWDEAGALFERAHVLNPSARTLRGMGLSAFEARRYADSLRHLQAALQEPKHALNAAQRKEVERSIERAKQYVGRLKLTLDPPSASVKINGQPAGLDENGELIIDPGLLEIEVSADGYDTELRRVRVIAGAHDELAVKLSAAQPSGAGIAAPAAMAQATAPLPPADRPEQASSLRTLKWVSGGIALAGLATGTVALIMGNAAASKWNACRDDTQPSCLANREHANDDRTVSVIGFAVGGGLAVLTAVLFVLDARQDSSPSSARICSPGPTEFGVTCRMAF